jgi:hypothetical protein
MAGVYRGLYGESSLKGGVTLLMKRDEGGVRPFDDLARGLESGAISRGKAMKLGGAALVASALGLFASQGAEAQTLTLEAARRRCLRRGGDFCRRSGCKICCGEGGRRRRACCGDRGCCCYNPRTEHCDNGNCRREN